MKLSSKWINNYLPALAWTTYHVFCRHWYIDFLSALLLFRGGVVLLCFLIRDEPTTRAPKYQVIIAWVSTFLPTLMVWNLRPDLAGLIGEIISVMGMVMFIFTCLELGKSFGVSPALRSPVNTGIYQYVRNPMYISHVVADVGILISSPMPQNLLIAGLAWSLYWLRARWERKLICDRTASVLSVAITQEVALT